MCRLSTLDGTRHKQQPAGCSDDGGRQRTNSIMNIVPCLYLVTRFARQRCRHKQNRKRQATGDNSFFFKVNDMNRWCDAAQLPFIQAQNFAVHAKVFSYSVSVFTSHNWFYPEKPQNPAQSCLFTSCYCRDADAVDLFSKSDLSSKRTANDNIIRHNRNNRKRRCYSFMGAKLFARL